MASSALSLHPDGLLPPEPGTRAIARRLHTQVAALPIVSPHGHTDPAWFADNAPFAKATELLLVPDHYVFRMLYSQGVDLDALGIPRADGSRAAVDPRAAWRMFAERFHLLRGMPSALWLNHVFHEVFGLRVQLDAASADLSAAAAARLFARVRDGGASAEDAELFRAQMLTEMAAMSVDDGLVMQLHPGCYCYCYRNHNRALFARYGRDKGADLPLRTGYVHALKLLLDRFGNTPGFTLILFTLDESTYARELAPLAGHYPALLLGPAWWFHDAPEGMWRFREQTLASACFYNTVGFNDDTRALLSIPARHDVARRVDCAFLAKLVAEHRLDEEEAAEVAIDLAYRLPKRAYRL